MKSRSSPARVSLVFLSHLTDGLVLSLCFVWVLFGLLLCLVWRSLTEFVPISRGSFRVRSSPDISIWDNLACLAQGRIDPSRFTCPVRTTSHSSHMSHRLQRDLSRLWCSGVGFLFGFCLFGLCVCLPVFGCLFLVSLCFFACLSSFTDWCTAHKQQFREQKKIVCIITRGETYCYLLGSIFLFNPLRMTCELDATIRAGRTDFQRILVCPKDDPRFEDVVASKNPAAKAC